MKTQNYILKNKKIPCIILARKGSKSLKNKNLININVFVYTQDQKIYQEIMLKRNQH